MHSLRWSEVQTDHMNLVTIGTAARLAGQTLSGGHNLLLTFECLRKLFLPVVSNGVGQLCAQSAGVFRALSYVYVYNVPKANFLVKILVFSGLDTSKHIANFTDPVAVAVSEVVRFVNPNEPLQGHLSLTTDPTEMM